MSPRYSSSGDHARELNSLDYARKSFTWLVTGPQPLSLDGRDFPGLPPRQVPLDELRNLLLAHRCPQDTRDAVWAELVRRTRTGEAAWLLGAVGVALPALTKVAARLTTWFAGDPRDIHNEVLRGFLAELPVVDIDRPLIMLRLRCAAHRSGRLALTEAVGGPTPTEPGFWSSPPRPPSGHPDLVLAQAVADGVLTRTEADLIGTTRLEDVPVADWAQTHGVKLKATYKARDRAEQRLIAHLRQRSETAVETDPVASAVLDTTTSAKNDQAFPHQHSSLSVSGRRRNGSPISTRKSSAPVSKKCPKSGFQGCGGPMPATRHWEVPQCA